MAYQFQNVDTTEPVSDTDGELKANVHLYGVISGCDVTLDSGNLTVDVAAGKILHNGSIVSVSAQTNAVTLVADGSNPRFSWVALNSSGTAVLVSGDAAADPDVPELGDYVALSLIRIPAGETLASNCTDIEKRIPAHHPTSVVVKSADETVNNSTTMQSDDELTFTVAANSVYTVKAIIRYDSGATPDFKFQWIAPTAATIDGVAHVADSSYTAAGAVIAESTAITTTAGLGAGMPGPILCDFTVMTGANAGSVTLQWAQNTLDASDTKVLADSWLEHRMVA